MEKQIKESEFWILYALMDTSREYSQQDLCNAWYFPKQTTNSTISSLQKKGLSVNTGMSCCCRIRIYLIICMEHRLCEWRMLCGIMMPGISRTI